MIMTETEGRIIEAAVSKLSDTRVVKLVLDGKFSKHYPNAKRKDLAQLDAYSKEAILFAIFTPLARLFFCNRSWNDTANHKIIDEFAEYCKRYLQELSFGGGYLRCVNEGLNSKSKR